MLILPVFTHSHVFVKRLRVEIGIQHPEEHPFVSERAELFFRLIEKRFAKPFFLEVFQNIDPTEFPRARRQIFFPSVSDRGKSDDFSFIFCGKGIGRGAVGEDLLRLIGTQPIEIVIADLPPIGLLPCSVMDETERLCVG